jgi:hypothetical protein
MSAEKRYVLTFKIEAIRDEVPGDAPSPKALGFPIYKFQCSDLPPERFAQAFGVFLALLTDPHNTAVRDEMLSNLGKATDVDDLMLRDVERIARSR